MSCGVGMVIRATFTNGNWASSPQGAHVLHLDIEITAHAWEVAQLHLEIEADLQAAGLSHSLAHGGAQIIRRTDRLAELARLGMTGVQANFITRPSRTGTAPR